ncbi:MAG: MCE family protein [Saprospiraceae bacterium]|nr:MCE family protein [Saprospiraceae bacterium]
MKREKLSSVRLGLFVVIGSLLLIAGIYFVGANKSLFGSNINISTIFTNAGGLQAGNNVRYAGINVGTVRDIVIISDSTVRLDLKLLNRVQPFIRKNAVASLSIDGIVGSALVNITPGNGNAPVIEDGDFIEAAELPGTADLIATLGSTNENIALFARDLLEISDRVKSGPGTVNLLLQDSTVSTDIRSLVKNLTQSSMLTISMIQRLNTTLGQIEKQQGLLNRIIYDTVVMSNLKELSISLNESISGKLDSLMKALNQTGTNLQESTSKFDTLLDDIKYGGGPIGDLIYDDTSAQVIKNTLKNIEQGTARFNEDMEALQHNFLLRRFFRKQRKDSLKASRNGKP